jgi:hypothetical protein
VSEPLTETGLKVFPATDTPAIKAMQTDMPNVRVLIFIIGFPLSPYFLELELKPEGGDTISQLGLTAS